MTESVGTALGWICFVAAALCLLVFPFLAIPRRTRAAAGYGYVTASVVFGGSLWLMCAGTVYIAWGFLGLAFGVGMLGVGVLPMSLVIFGWNSEWFLFVEVIGIGALVFFLRILGFWIVEKAKSKIIR